MAELEVNQNAQGSAEVNRSGEGKRRSCTVGGAMHVVAICGLLR